MSIRLSVAVVAMVALAALGAFWLSGALDGDAAISEDISDAAAKSGAIDVALLRIIESARASSAQALTDASEAEAIAAVADKVAANAAKSATDGRAAAEEARNTARKACKAPGPGLGCASAADGTRYEGAQLCRADGCGPDGYGVFTDARRGWESEGRWENWSLVLGCDSMKGVITYCGQQVASAWSGYGVSYNANAAAISAKWMNGVGQNPIQLDYPGGSRMRGEMLKYELDGLGIYERYDKRVLRGRWQAGKLISGAIVYPASGDIVSGVFADGNAYSGTIRYRDGRLFVGAIEDASALAQPRPANGALYAPDGSMEHKGVWRDGRPAD